MSNLKTKRKRRLPSNWRSRFELVHIQDKDSDVFEFVLQWRKGLTPTGFMCHIGRLSYYESKESYWIKEVQLENYFKNRRLGLMMYEYALDEFGSLSTNYHNVSDEAKRVWNSLCRKYPYNTDFFSGRLTVYKEQP